MAGLSLSLGAPTAVVKTMMKRIEAERKQVQSIIRGELEKMMKMGAEVTEMTYNSKGSFNLERSCRKPEHMRRSYVQDGSPMNIQRVHFIFHELPVCTYQDVMMKRQSHMQYVCQIVESKMRMQWATQKLDVRGAHRNCIQRVYGRLFNEKKMTVCRRNNNGCPHNRFLFVRNPKCFKDSNCSVNYKKGKTLFYWKQPREANSEVSQGK
jgi:hypothetical protein